ncbi:MAG: flagellar biosynthesis protein FlhF [Bacillota bacterium]
MMQVKRYLAPTFAEALIQAKNELGTDAVIVESRKLKVGGIFGFFGREMTELTVAVDQRPANRPLSGPTPAARAAAPSPSPAPGMPPAAMAAASQVAIGRTSAPAGAVAVAAPEPRAADSYLSSLQKEMAGLKVAVTRLLENNANPAALRELHGFGLEVFETLLDAGVDQSAALDIGRMVTAGGEQGKSLLQQELQRLMGPGAPIEIKPGQRKIVALVGPTGVGKTTTLAKLAAHFALERGLKVGLVTSDTFRIAAIEQLRTYADILGIPVYTVERPEDAANAMKETVDCDLVLVDTGGRNHRDKARMAELRELLAVLHPDETHLVVSLNVNPRDAFDMLEHYLPLGVNRFIFTKLDEATSPGLLLNIRMKYDKPVGYVTHGQAVPDDIIPADQVDFSKILLGA